MLLQEQSGVLTAALCRILVNLCGSYHGLGDVAGSFILAEQIRLRYPWATCYLMVDSRALCCLDQLFPGVSTDWINERGFELLHHMRLAETPCCDLVCEFFSSARRHAFKSPSHWNPRNTLILKSNSMHSPCMDALIHPDFHWYFCPPGIGPWRSGVYAHVAGAKADADEPGVWRSMIYGLHNQNGFPEYQGQAKEFVRHLLNKAGKISVEVIFPHDYEQVLDAGLDSNFLASYPNLHLMVMGKMSHQEVMARLQACNVPVLLEGDNMIAAALRMGKPFLVMRSPWNGRTVLNLMRWEAQQGACLYTQLYGEYGQQASANWGLYFQKFWEQHPQLATRLRSSTADLIDSYDVVIQQGLSARQNPSQHLPKTLGSDPVLYYSRYLDAFQRGMCDSAALQEQRRFLWGLGYNWHDFECAIALPIYGKDEGYTGKGEKNSGWQRQYLTWGRKPARLLPIPQSQPMPLPLKKRQGRQAFESSRDQYLRPVGEGVQSNQAIWRLDLDPLPHAFDGLGCNLTGASVANLLKLPAPLRRQLLENLFSEQNGIGLQLLRIPIGSSDFQDMRWGLVSYQDDPAQEVNLGMEADLFSVLHDIKQIQPQLQLLLSPWSAPAWMKHSGQMHGGRLKKKHWRDYASYLCAVLQAYQQRGFDVAYLTLVNEPFHNTPYLPSMGMTFDEQFSFIQHEMAPMLAESRLATRLMLLDHNWSYAQTLRAHMEMLGVNPYVAGVAFHGYVGKPEMMRLMAKWPDLCVWITEQTGQLTDDNWHSFQYWIKSLLISGFESGASACLTWNLCLDEHLGPTCMPGRMVTGLLQLDFSDPNQVNYQFQPECYALSHVASFVKTGAKIHALRGTCGAGLSGMAFLNPDCSWCVLLDNQSDSVKNIELELPGYGLMQQTVSAQAVLSLVIRDSTDRSFVR